MPSLGFKIDENLPEDAAGVLREAGHRVTTVVGQRLAGAGDARLAEVLKQEGLALVTLDVGFADIRTYPPQEYPGLVVLRLTRQEKPQVLAVIRRMLPLLSAEPVTGRLWLVEEHAVRIRGGEA